MTVPLDAPVRIQHLDGTHEDTTIDTLVNQYRVTFTTGVHSGRKRLGTVPVVRHFHCELVPDMNRGAVGFWPISQAAFLSRSPDAVNVGATIRREEADAAALAELEPFAPLPKSKSTKRKKGGR